MQYTSAESLYGSDEGSLDASPTDGRVQAEQLRLLYASAAKAVAATIINTPIVVYVFWDVLPHNVLFAWMAVNWVVAFAAPVLSVLFHRDEQRFEHFRTWQSLLLLRLLLAGASVSCLTAFFTTSQPLAHHAFFFFVCGGMVAGAAGVYAVRLEMFSVYGGAVILPLAIRLFTFPGEMYFAMGLMVSIFLIVVFSGVRSMHAATTEALTLRFVNEDLANRLKKEKALTEEANRELARARDELWGEMQLARKIQTALVPVEPALPGYRIATHTEPADEVGGDYHDVYSAAGRHWVLVGDVSGHGVTAGLVMMMAQTAVRSMLTHNPEMAPSELLIGVNRVLTDNIRQLDASKYMTLTALAMDEDGTCHFAGLHQDMLIHRRATGGVDVVKTEGLWVGLEPDIRGMAPEGSFRLETGDVLLLYTDGLTEAKAASPQAQETADGRYGFDQLSSKLTELGEEDPEVIRDGLVKSLVHYDNSDDVTIVVLRREA